MKPVPGILEIPVCPGMQRSPTQPAAVDVELMRGCALKHKSYRSPAQFTIMSCSRLRQVFGLMAMTMARSVATGHEGYPVRRSDRFNFLLRWQVVPGSLKLDFRHRNVHPPYAPEGDFFLRLHTGIGWQKNYRNSTRMRPSRIIERHGRQNFRRGKEVELADKSHGMVLHAMTWRGQPPSGRPKTAHEESCDDAQLYRRGVKKQRIRITDKQCDSGAQPQESDRPMQK